MIGDNNPLVILALIVVAIALLRGIAIEGARMENYRHHPSQWLPDEHCKDAGNLTILLLICAVGACGGVYFLLNLLTD